MAPSLTDAWLPGIPGMPAQASIRQAGRPYERYSDEQGRCRSDGGQAARSTVSPTTPILGYGVINVKSAAACKSEARDSFDFHPSTGRLLRRGGEMVAAENLSKVLYPNDEPEVARNCASSSSISSFLLPAGHGPHHLPTWATCPLADKFVASSTTSPGHRGAGTDAAAVDEYGLPWNRPGHHPKQFAYTTTRCCRKPWKPAAGPVPAHLRHLEIIYEINQRFLDEVRMRFLGDEQR